MPNAPRVDRSIQCLPTEDADPLGPTRSWALAIVALSLAFLATVAPTPIATAGSQQSATQRPQTATRVATAKTPTIVALELSRVVDGVPQLPEDALERIVAAAQEASGLILLDTRGLPLRHASLPPASQRTIERDAYERGLSLQLAAGIKDARARAPGVAFGILGLPFEQGPSAAESNASYEAALQAVDVMNPLGGVIAAGTNPTAIVRDRYRSSISLAAGRPVVFRGGSGWQVATSPGGPTAQRETEQVVASDGGSVAVAPATAAGVSTVSVSSVVADWGTNASGADLNADGVVDGFDLAVALALNPDELLAPPGGGGGGGGGGDSGGGGTPPNGGGSGPGGDSGVGEDPLANTPVLVVGPGFSGQTPPPMPVGTSDAPGYSATVIARWSAVPFQSIKDLTTIGVVAFHRNGVDRVEFSVNGGPWQAVSLPKHNPQSGLWEYFAIIDPSDIPDGQLEVRAVAFPKSAGQPRLLAGPYRATPSSPPPANGQHSFFLWANSQGGFDRAPVYVSLQGNDGSGDGSLASPFSTIGRATEWIHGTYGSCDGATIFLLPGTHSANLRFPVQWQSSSANDRWLTIAAAPGVPRSEVELVPGPHPTLLRLVRLRGLRAVHSGEGVIWGAVGNGSIFWMDGTFHTAAGGRYSLNQAGGISSQASRYYTDCEIHDSRNGPVGAILVRQTAISKIAEDALNWAGLAANVDVVDIDPHGEGSSGYDYHPDLFQYYSSAGVGENMIAYGVACRDSAMQWIHFTPTALRNCAWVNVLVEARPGNMVGHMNGTEKRHLLLLNCTIRQVTLFSNSAIAADCAFVGNVFAAVTVEYQNASLLQSVQAAHWMSNHFVGSTGWLVHVFGGDASIGPWAQIVVDSAAGNYVPIPGSALLGRLDMGMVGVDLAGVKRPAAAAVGSFEAAPAGASP